MSDPLLSAATDPDEPEVTPIKLIRTDAARRSEGGRRAVWARRLRTSISRTSTMIAADTDRDAVLRLARLRYADNPNNTLANSPAGSRSACCMGSGGTRQTTVVADRMRISCGTGASWSTRNRWSAG